MRHSDAQTVRRGLRALVVASVALLATLALAATGAVAAHVAAAEPPKPPVGTWQLAANPDGPAYINGTFTITSNYYVTAFQGTLTDLAQSACGTGTVTVTGKQKITYHAVAGQYQVDGHDSESLLSVKLTHNGKKIKGKFQLAFYQAVGGGGETGNGSLIYGGCNIPFGIQPPPS